MGADREHDVDLRDLRDRDQVFLRIVRQLLHRRGKDAHAVDAGEQQRVAVGRRIDDELRTEDARGAGLVLDDHLRADQRAKRVRRHTGNRVDDAARRAVGDQLDRAVGIALCAGAVRQQRARSAIIAAATRTALRQSLP